MSIWLYAETWCMYKIKQDKYTMDPGELNLLKQFCQSINNFGQKV